MSAAQMTAEQVLAWKAGWEAVNRREIEELRAADTTTKLRQLAAMMASNHLFESRADREAGVEAVRQRWMKLHRALDTDVSR